MVRTSASASMWASGVAIALLGVLALAKDTVPPSLAEDILAFQAPAEPPATPMAPAATETDGTLTLADALALALMGNPELQAFSWETRAGEARTLQARKLPNPELAFRISQLDVQADDPTTDDEDAATRLILSQVFELGGKRKGRGGSEVLPAARALFEAHRQGLEISTAGFDDVLEARGDFADAEFAFVEALVEVHQALAGLRGVLGRSLDGVP